MYITDILFKLVMVKLYLIESIFQFIHSNYLHPNKRRYQGVLLGALSLREKYSLTA